MNQSEQIQFAIDYHYDIVAERCKRRFFYFVQEFWDIIIPEEPVYNWHIPYLCDELQKLVEVVFKREPKLYDLAINVPPGSTKSTICTQMLPAWCWIIDPTVRTISGSYSNDLAIDHSVKSRDIITSDKYKKCFPNIWIQPDKNNKANYQNNHNGTRNATSVGGTITGKHAHIIIIDDPINPKQASSEAERKNANEWMSKTLPTRKVNKAVTPTILIMQRLHEQDPTGVWLEKKKDKIKHICLPAEISKYVSPPKLKKFYVNGLLDPIRISRAVCEEMKTDLGSYGYAGQFQQRPAPDEGGIFKKDWFLHSTLERLRDSAKSAKKKLTWYFSMDGAYTANEANDPSGFMAYAYFENCLYIREVSCVWMEQPELERFIPEFTERNEYGGRSRIWVEPKANGISTAQNIKRRTKLNIVIDKPPTTDKIARARDAAPFVEAERVILLGNGHWVDKFIEEVSTFPNAPHDECVDLLCMAVDSVDRLNDEVEYKSAESRNYATGGFSNKGAW